MEDGFQVTGGSTYRLGAALKSIKKLDWGSKYNIYAILARVHNLVKVKVDGPKRQKVDGLRKWTDREPKVDDPQNRKWTVPNDWKRTVQSMKKDGPKHESGRSHAWKWTVLSMKVDGLKHESGRFLAWKRTVRID